jgi:hypothetical protein
LRAVCVENEGQSRAAGQPEVQAAFDRLVAALHRALKAPESRCALGRFAFPVLTSRFLGTDAILQMWSEIENQLDVNNSK